MPKQADGDGNWVTVDGHHHFIPGNGDHENVDDGLKGNSRVKKLVVTPDRVGGNILPSKEKQPKGHK